MADLGLRGERQVISIFRHHAPGATAALVGKAAHVTLVCRSRRELKKSRAAIVNCFTFSGLTRPLMFLALGTSEAPQYRPGGT